MIIEDKSQNEHPFDEESSIEQEESIWTIGRKSKDHRKTGEKSSISGKTLLRYLINIILFIAICIAMNIVVMVILALHVVITAFAFYDGMYGWLLDGSNDGKAILIIQWLAMIIAMPLSYMTVNRLNKSK